MAANRGNTLYCPFSGAELRGAVVSAFGVAGFFGSGLSGRLRAARMLLAKFCRHAA